MMSEIKIITYSAAGQTFNLPEANNKSRNIVYCAQCYLCNKQYTRKSSNKLQTSKTLSKTHCSNHLIILNVILYKHCTLFGMKCNVSTR